MYDMNFSPPDAGILYYLYTQLRPRNGERIGKLGMDIYRVPPRKSFLVFVVRSVMILPNLFLFLFLFLSPSYIPLIISPQHGECDRNGGFIRVRNIINRSVRHWKKRKEKKRKNLNFFFKGLLKIFPRF